MFVGSCGEMAGLSNGSVLGERVSTADYTQPESNFIKSKMGDIDVGQQFHNFLVHPSERYSLGLSVIETNADNGAVEDHEFYRSCRYPFGWKSLPYMSCQAQNRILEECRGNRNDPRNRWQWHQVVLNLPCSKTYDASLPRISNHVATKRRWKACHSTCDVC